MFVALVAVLFTLVISVLASADPVLAQESPYSQELGGGGDGGIFAPLQGLPLWAQAALASATVGLVFFSLIEVGHTVWDRLQKNRSGRHTE